MKNIVIVDLNNAEQGILQAEWSKHGLVSVIHGDKINNEDSRSKIVEAQQIIFCVDLTTDINMKDINDFSGIIRQARQYMSSQTMMSHSMIGINFNGYAFIPVTTNFERLKQINPGFRSHMIYPENPNAEIREWMIRKPGFDPHPLRLADSDLFEKPNNPGSYGKMSPLLDGSTIQFDLPKKPGFLTRFKNALKQHPLMISLSTILPGLAGAGGVGAAAYFTGLAFSIALGPIPTAIILGFTALMTIAALGFAVSVGIAVMMDSGGDPIELVESDLDSDSDLEAEQGMRHVPSSRLGNTSFPTVKPTMKTPVTAETHQAPDTINGIQPNWGNK